MAYPNFINIGTSKLNNAKYLDWAEKVYNKTCEICLYSGYNCDGGCKQCPVEGAYEQAVTKIRKRMVIMNKARG